MKNYITNYGILNAAEFDESGNALDFAAQQTRIVSTMKNNGLAPVISEGETCYFRTDFDAKNLPPRTICLYHYKTKFDDVVSIAYLTVKGRQIVEEWGGFSLATSARYCKILGVYDGKADGEKTDWTH